jgi:hypothetical protein
MTRPRFRPSRSSTDRRITRRRFITLLAAGSAAALTAPARGLAAPTPPATKRPAPGPKVLAEIEKQKKFAADALKVIRAYPLPPGSEMAFAFRPLRPKRRK